LQAQNIVHNEAFLKSLNLKPLIPRYALIGKHWSLKARLKSCVFIFIWGWSCCLQGFWVIHPSLYSSS
jgi:hypothetical protein